MSREITSASTRLPGRFDIHSERRSLKLGLEHSQTLIHFRNLNFFPFPESGYINTEFAFNARHFFDSNQEGDPVSVRYNFDQAADWQTDFLAEPIVYHRFYSGGIKTVTMQARKGDLLSEVITKEIYVREGLRIGESLLNDIGFSPDGDSMVILSSNRIKVLGIQSGDTLLIGGYEEEVTVMKMSAEGDVLFTGSSAGTVKTWNPVTGECLQVFHAHDGSVLSMHPVPGRDEVLTYGSDQNLVLWSISEATPLWTVQLPREYVRSLALSPDGTRFALGSEYKTIITGDMKSGAWVSRFEYDNSWIDSLVYQESTGRLLATTRNGEFARVIDVEHELTVIDGGSSDKMMGIVFSGDGRFALSSSKDHRVTIWDLTEGRVLSDFYSTDDWIFNNPFSKGKPYVACRGWDNSIKIFDYTTGSCYAIFLMPEGYLKASEFHPDDKRVAVGGTDNKIKIWNLATGTIESAFDTGYVWPRTLSFSPDGKHFAYASDEKTVQIWDIDTVSFLHDIEIPEDRIRQVAFFGSEPLILIRGEQSLTIYDCRTNEIIQSFEGNQKIVKSAILSPEGNYLLACGLDYVVKLYGLTTGKVVTDYRGLTSMAIEIRVSENSHFVYARTEAGQLAVWDRGSGSLLWMLDDPRRKVTAMAISPDGLVLATGIRQDLQLWSTITGNDLGTIGSHQQNITAVVFHPDKPMVISGGLDNMTRIWSLQERSMIATIKGGTNLRVSPNGRYLMNGYGGEMRIWNIDEELRGLR